jgi:hypothetical protein
VKSEETEVLVKHQFDIHARCPFVPQEQWDYYTVTITTKSVIDVHEIEKLLNNVRGMNASQEAIAETLRFQMDRSEMTGSIEVVGRHSQNSRTTVLS